MNTQQVVLITFGNNPKLGIVLPVGHLPLATDLIAIAKIVKPNNEYKSDPSWEPYDALPTIRVIDGARVQAPSPEVLEARKDADDNNTRWYTEHTAHQATKKALAESNAKVEALLAAGTCHAPAPEVEQA